MDWTPNQVATLTRLWADGWTAFKIGRELGVTKSAIVGKAHRLHLQGRPNPCKSRGRAKPPVRARGPKIAKPAKVKTVAGGPPSPLPPIDRTAADSRRAYFTQIGTNGHGCAAPLGEPRTPEFKLCGEPAVVGRSYCIEHAVEYLRPVKPL